MEKDLQRSCTDFKEREIFLHETTAKNRKGFVCLFLTLIPQAVNFINLRAIENNGDSACFSGPWERNIGSRQLGKAKSQELFRIQQLRIECDQLMLKNHSDVVIQIILLKYTFVFCEYF